MARELLERKLTHLFNLLDTTGDGRLDLHDVDLIVDNHEREIGSALDSEAMARYRAWVRGWWDDMVAFADTDADGSVSPAEFVALFLLAADSREGVVLAANNAFDLFDTNADDFISLDEYLEHQRAFGVDDAGGPAVFEAFDADGDGLLSRHEFAELYLDFYTSDDPEAVGNRLYGEL